MISLRLYSFQSVLRCLLISTYDRCAISIRTSSFRCINATFLTSSGLPRILNLRRTGPNRCRVGGLGGRDPEEGHLPGGG
jgi:hypothetical protein